MTLRRPPAAASIIIIILISYQLQRFLSRSFVPRGPDVSVRILLQLQTTSGRPSLTIIRLKNSLTSPPPPPPCRGGGGRPDNETHRYIHAPSTFLHLMASFFKRSPDKTTAAPEKSSHLLSRQQRNGVWWRHL